MSALARIAGFVLLLAVVLAAGFGTGRLVGPLDDDPTPPAEHSGGGHAGADR
ncbi:hypothetical protein [Nocardioides nanhaiensis]|uniref:DUF2613 family protein n=1 Tax=Nocardioides nanhaiensis TaxID=1476871 RepID=A0ABP8VTQ3_9ACTN